MTGYTESMTSTWGHYSHSSPMSPLLLSNSNVSPKLEHNLFFGTDVLPSLDFSLASVPRFCDTGFIPSLSPSSPYPAPCLGGTLKSP